MKKFILLNLTFTAIFINLLISQIPNPSFENWTDVNGVLKPDGWNFLSGSGIPVTVTKSTPGADSPTAAKMTVMSFQSNPWCSMLQSNFSFTSRPQAFTFYIKSNNSSHDTLIISIALFKNNIPIGDGVMEISDNIPGYTMKAVKMEYFDTITQPDAGYIYIGFEANSLHIGTEFYIDGMQERQYWGGINDIANSNFSIGEIYPNPASSIINIPVSVTKPTGINIKTLDITGTVIKSSTEQIKISGDNNIKINTDVLKKGVYLIAIKTEEGYSITKKIIKY